MEGNTQENSGFPFGTCFGACKKIRHRNEPLFEHITSSQQCGAQ